jgi:cytochrome c-type biogenesis protein
MFISKSILGANLGKRVLLPILVAGLSLSTAFIGAALLGGDGGIDGINRFVETLSGDSGSFLGDLGRLAPLGFAFAAGMVSAVNPCGFVMLPAYLGLYLRINEKDGEDAHPIKHVARAFQVGASVTIGFIALFGTVGLIMSLGARAAVVDILPWLGLTIGIALAVTGSWMVGGGKLYTGFAAQAASRIGDPGQVNSRGYFLFGLSYGIASLSCTLPIFLSVIGTSFAVSNIATSLGQFLLYALGMGTVILGLTLGMAFFKGAMVRALRKALPYVEPIGSWLMVVAGSYIVFYWLTIGGLL